MKCGPIHRHLNLMTFLNTILGNEFIKVVKQSSCSKGGKIRFVRRCRRKGKAVLIMELIHNVATEHGGYSSLFSGVGGDDTREINDLWNEMKESGVKQPWYMDK